MQMWPKNEANSALRASIRARERTERGGCARPAPFACLEKVELRGVFEFLSYAATGPRALASDPFRKCFRSTHAYSSSSSSSSFSFAFSRSVYTNVGPFTPPPSLSGAPL